MSDNTAILKAAFQVILRRIWTFPLMRPREPAIAASSSAVAATSRVLMLHTGWEEISIERYKSAFDATGATSYFKAVSVSGIKDQKQLPAWNSTSCDINPNRMHTCTHQHVQLWQIVRSEICTLAKATLQEVRRQFCLFVKYRPTLFYINHALRGMSDCIPGNELVQGGAKSYSEACTTEARCNIVTSKSCLVCKFHSASVAK
eukprot:1186107-Prorocentrum_minimum.AAC.2